MTVEISLLLAAVGCIIGVLSYVGGKQAGAKKDGHEWGAFQAELRADVKHIKEDMAEVKAQNKLISEQQSNIRTEVEVVKRDLKTAFHKIDDIKVRGT